MADKCSHCGKGAAGVPLKRCSVCKNACYCGAECQNAGWKKHKKNCTAPLPRLTMPEAVNKIETALRSGNLRGVLEWEGRMEVLIVDQPDITRSFFLSTFANAHASQLEHEVDAAGSRHHAREVIRLEKSRLDLLGRIEHFREQGEALHNIGQHLLIEKRPEEAVKYLQKARDLGAAHGLFTVECRACSDLGRIALQEGRQEEGLDLYRNTLAAAPLVEENEGLYELNALDRLVEALLSQGGADALDEVAPLIPRYREAARKESRRDGSVMVGSAARSAFYQELLSYTVSARLLEIACYAHFSFVISPATTIVRPVSGARTACKGGGGGVRAALPRPRKQGGCPRHARAGARCGASLPTPA
ncbi:hypothetical protein T484DRAFT_3047670 [Baffinella frigidus]|nr:hypothetical protein T484DRAFT_3047670 [Cryptophyta sp. CCMP2293]